MGYTHDPALWRLWNHLAERAADLHDVRLLDDPRPPRQGASGHMHHIPTLLVPLRGSLRVEALAGRCDLRPGQALLITPATWHDQRPLRGDATALHQGFMADWSDVSLLQRNEWLSGKAPRQPYHGLFERACDAEAGDARLDLIRDALSHLVEERIDDLATPHAAVQRMCRCLWWRYHQGITAADVIATSGCSQAQAYRLFVDFFGRPPKQELIRMRLQTAYQLLRHGLTVAEVGERVGFSSTASFTRAYRKRYGARPGHRLAGRASA